MSINVADNFSYKGGKPLDARTKYASISDMVATPAADLYDGCLAYVTAEKKNYQYDSTNTTDPTLGKWRELETGGGGGTTYTAGDGIDITSDVISTDNLQSGDMDDVVTPLPAVTTRKEFIKYSTDEQIVGEWIDGKPVYQKVFTGLSCPIQHLDVWVVLTNIPNCKEVIAIDVYYYNSGLQRNNMASIREVEVLANGNVTVLGTQVGRTYDSAVIRYTKTTD